MATLDEIRSALAGYEPVIDASRQHAAVAMVFRSLPKGPDLLFIERARRAGDPWSGQMAFPGGRLDARDAHSREAEERETQEEVGLSLGGAEVLGRLDDQFPRQHGGLVISAFVYHLEAPGSLRINYEVQEALWIPLRSLEDPSRQVAYRYPPAGNIPFPGVQVGEPEHHVVWGLTYRFLEDLFRILGRPLSHQM